MVSAVFIMCQWRPSRRGHAFPCVGHHFPHMATHFSMLLICNHSQLEHGNNRTKSSTQCLPVWVKCNKYVVLSVSPSGSVFSCVSGDIYQYIHVKDNKNELGIQDYWLFCLAAPTKIVTLVNSSNICQVLLFKDLPGRIGVSLRFNVPKSFFTY